MPSKCRPNARKYFENVDKNIAVLRFDRDRCSEYKRSTIRSPCKSLSKTRGVLRVHERDTWILGMEIATLQYIFLVLASTKCWLVKLRRMQWGTWTHFLFPSCLIKKCTNSFFFLSFFHNINLESKGEMNYFYLFSPYRERVGFITFIYFTFFLSP